MSSGKIVTGFIAGAAVGAILGVLFAPDKGSETRKSIMSKTDEYASDMKEKFNIMLEKVAQKVGMTKEEATEFVEKGKELFDAEKTSAEDIKEHVKSFAYQKYSPHTT